MTRALRLIAPAKINWTLEVLRIRPDGYHEIRSVLQTIALYDTVTLTEAAGGDISLEIAGDNSKFVQLSYVFTQQGQWRNLLAQPELLSALQPNDVRPAGSCDIQLAEDMNSITYSCAGSTPTVYQRVHPAAPE